MIPLGNFFFRYRNLVFPIYFAAMAALIPPVLPEGDIQLDAFVDLLGFMIALSGQALRAAVIGYAYIRRGGKDKKVYADDLVIEGFFAHSRNPLYVGNLLVLFGLSVIHGAPMFILVCAVFYGLAYRAIVAAEENFLRSKFSDQYDAYCRRVNRFLPNLAGLQGSLAGMEYDWKRVLRKEYGSTFTWLLTALALLIYERIHWFGFEQKWIQSYLLASLLVPLLAAYITVRVLKKRKLLGRD